MGVVGHQLKGVKELKVVQAGGGLRFGLYLVEMAVVSWHSSYATGWGTRSPPAGLPGTGISIWWLLLRNAKSDGKRGHAPAGFYGRLGDY